MAVNNAGCESLPGNGRISYTKDQLLQYKPNKLSRLFLALCDPTDIAFIARYKKKRRGCRGGKNKQRDIASIITERKSQSKGPGAQPNNLIHVHIEKVPLIVDREVTGFLFSYVPSVFNILRQYSSLPVYICIYPLTHVPSIRLYSK